MIQSRRLVFGELLLASSLDTFWYPCYEKRNRQREAKRKGMEEITIETAFLGIPSSCDGDSGLGKIRYVNKFEKDYGSNWVKTVVFSDSNFVRDQTAG